MKKGFTLLEMVFSVSIIAIVVIVALVLWPKKSHDSDVVTSVKVNTTTQTQSATEKRVLNNKQGPSEAVVQAGKEVGEQKIDGMTNRVVMVTRINLKEREAAIDARLAAYYAAGGRVGLKEQK